jgi:hypothetical protein
LSFIQRWSCGIEHTRTTSVPPAIQPAIEPLSSILLGTQNPVLPYLYSLQTATSFLVAIAAASLALVDAAIEHMISSPLQTLSERLLTGKQTDPVIPHLQMKEVRKAVRNVEIAALGEKVWTCSLLNVTGCLSPQELFPSLRTSECPCSR